MAKAGPDKVKKQQPYTKKTQEKKFRQGLQNAKGDYKHQRSKAISKKNRATGAALRKKLRGKTKK